MARRKPQKPAQDVEASGLDEFHPDTTHNPAEGRERPEGTHPAPDFRPPNVDKNGDPIPDRRRRYREVK